MRIFFSSSTTSGTLPDEEAQHAARVLRLKTGDSIQIINGKGHLTSAQITSIDKRNCAYQITHQKYFENPVAGIEIAVAPPKSSDRLEWMLEKMTEIGVEKIHLILTKRTEKPKLNLERLQKKIISAAKQSHKYYLPELIVHPVFSDFLDQTNTQQKFIAHLADEDRKYLGTELKPTGSACVLIGPEGDFSPEEIKLALEHQFQPITLGEFRLRTETAAVFANTLVINARYL